jgi:FAD-dependent urate hydroxylase
MTDTCTALVIGGGLSIAPNGLNALHVLEADSLVRRIGIPMTAMVIQSWTGKQLAEFGGLPGLPRHSVRVARGAVSGPV